MIVIADTGLDVAETYSASFNREGIAATAFGTADLESWIATADATEVGAVEAFIFGYFQHLEKTIQSIRKISPAPVIVIGKNTGLDNILKLFSVGSDDVVQPNIHVRELVARLGAIRRRLDTTQKVFDVGGFRVYFDGRDPEFNGMPVDLPRRERRILEYLIVNRTRRVTRAQIFNAVYGVFNADVEENVIESHISKLRKKLKRILGHDPIDTKRFLGYQFVAKPTAPTMPVAA
jgi:DNA-binding response OmpR family regulator